MDKPVIILCEKSLDLRNTTVSHEFFYDKPVILTRNFGNRGVEVHAFISGGDGNTLQIAREIKNSYCQRFKEFTSAQWKIWY